MYTVNEENQKCIPCDGMGYSRKKTSIKSGVIGSGTSTVPSSGPTTFGPTTFGPTVDGSFSDPLFDTSFDSGALGSGTITVPSSGPTSGPTMFGPTFDGGPPAAAGNISCSALWLEFEESDPYIYIDKCAKLKKECIICDVMTNITNSTYTNNTNASPDTASFDIVNGPNAEDNIEI
jgi:hypothetical protein